MAGASEQFTDCPQVILGGGPAGLSVGYYLEKGGLHPQLFEASDTLGGACQSKTFAGFRYDMGAHRFHNVYPEVTAEVERLLGEQLSMVNAPSHIFHRGKAVPFPPGPVDLAKALGLWQTAASVVPVLLRSKRSCANFDEDVVAKYGRLAAESFLLNYSEKLWGLPAKQLAVEVSGKRLRGLDLKATLRNLLGIRHAEHLDGAFYYPKNGFGQLTDALASRIRRLHTRAPVARLLHRNGRIEELVLKDGRAFRAREVVSTLPLPALIRMLEPSAPADVLELASSLRFRSLRLAVLTLNVPSVSRSASLYFPSKDVPFTRIYEPKLRSSALAPAGQTCLVLEFPVFAGDELDQLSREQFLELARNALVSTGLVQAAALGDGTDDRVKDAYPVLDVDAGRRLGLVEAYLARFTNLERIGRAACFSYSHFHDLMRDGRRLADKLVAKTDAGETSLRRLRVSASSSADHTEQGRLA